ncbi:hypothetical protein NBRC110019_04790 [Neptunitalea chrysea]|uniref:DUF3050 domain-containing protein n=1 Tax=Neptunitalea chrysea TaxID=1647581 RepID=A0A9W6ET98_9FLAO|nr:DUF3050 domain-containing protein [Neptunitalea chrysea]GLB51440.1 hypothetical protein NBRC110019_04790 [Neptunitalea chrysea]
MTSTLQESILPFRKILLNHKLYKKIQNPDDLKVFLEHHVYAVWDFMSLLKSLQQQLTCTTTPWIPYENPETRYLINEIVLAEETDINKEGQRQSHYEMYLDAMIECGANTTTIKAFLATIAKNDTPIETLISESNLEDSIKAFLQFTFRVIKEGKPHKIAAAFTFGREDLIPDMFTAILKEMQQHFPELNIEKLVYYFDRHIELDEEEHGPMALQMVSELCGTDEQKWQEATDISIEALKYRIHLWDGIFETITQKEIA